MESLVKNDITVSVTVGLPVDKVWEFFNNPFHVLHWAKATDDWQTVYAENNPVKGGRFLYRMEPKDGSGGFDFSGKYDEVDKYHHIHYVIDDGRNVSIDFITKNNSTLIEETFEAENQNPVDVQHDGWQAILDNFKEYAESWKNKDVLHYEMMINRDPMHVYKTLINPETHAQWTSAFNPTSRYEGSWEKGATLKFLGDDPQHGGEGGMICRVRENIPGKFISVEYTAFLKDGKEINSGKEFEGWKGAMENYTFRETNGNTILTVDSETTEEFKGYFIETWPKAMAKLKEICERK